MPDHSFARAWTTVAALAPERTAIVCGDRRVSFGDFDERATRLAHVLHGGGVRTGDKVAIDCVNSPEYLETFFAALKLGAVPVNVNYRYVGRELAYLLDNSDSTALVFHDELAPKVVDALSALASDKRPSLLLQVRHDGDGKLPEGALDYESALGGAPGGPAPGGHEASGDDVVFVYTGGTTGLPKAVMWRSDDLYVALWQMARPGTEPPEPAESVRRNKRAATALPACPLMHGTGLFITLSTLSGGGTVVLIDTPRLDCVRLWDAVVAHDVQVLTIVGDAFARPLLAALDANPGRWDLSSLSAITSSGVTWSPETKRGLLSHLPHALLIDSLGASEGIMSRNETRGGEDIRPARFTLSERMVVVTDDGRLAEPGDGRIGMLGVGGPIPLGYYKDDEKTAATFRLVGSRRYSIPGDYATVEADGSITLLGRGSACINTGGEKVYPEEIELVLRSHRGVIDAVVVGVADERWGETVVALVQGEQGVALEQASLTAHCRERLAGYKVPKRFVVLDTLHRSPSGKADYKILRAIAARGRE